MTLRIILVFVALALVVGVPFLLRPEQNLLAAADNTLIIVSPHNEAIRHEFTRAFTDWYQQQTGRTVRIDWRIVGGTSEIAKYLKSEYFTAFRREWEAAGNRWTPEVQAAFDNYRVEPAADDSDDDPARQARRAFLESETGIGIDLFFGGGEYDFQQQALAGRLVPSRILQTHPEWFSEDSIPQSVSGENFYDPDGRWIGTCLSAFGIVYNIDSLERLGFRAVPDSWTDLTSPLAFKQVALADPTKSGSAAKAFEMVIQQQMQQAVEESGNEEEGIREGWLRGLQIIQQASANARYFTDAAGKVPMDVSLGDAALGMCIDFYGRFQSEAVRAPDGTSRLVYFTPIGGSSVGVDPVGILRGAPHPEIAERFIEFVLSMEGQKLWNFQVGTPGGPNHYALRRPPIRKELYDPKFQEFRSDPDVDPYRDADSFYYHSEWTIPLFRALTFIIRVSCLDTHDEQRAAWQAIIEAGMPADALAVFSDLSAVNYDVAMKEITPVLRSANRIEEVQLAKRLGDHFRRQYREAAALARKHPRVSHPEPGDVLIEEIETTVAP